MIFLLDTHILLWAALFAGTPADQLPAEAVRLIRDPANEVWFRAPFKTWHGESDGVRF
jgi:PIN domain nuclease of toxin-antitoxin system